MGKLVSKILFSIQDSYFTLFESENEWQKIEQVPILFLRASRNEKKIYNWTLEIIPFVRFIILCFDIGEVPRSP